MYDPLELAERVERAVIHGERRKYYRFRAAKFYGGIATADAVGCNLRCIFCWSGNVVWHPEKSGAFYSPEEVAQNLRKTAAGKGYHQVRVSGGEPTIGRGHLIALLGHLNREFLFILETNGILLGADRTYVEELSAFPNIHVRVCLKGCTAEEFSRLTGARSGFEYQMKSLEYLRDMHVSFNVALVSMKKEKGELFSRLLDMGLGNIMMEEERIMLYPSVRRRLEQAGMLEYFMDE